MEPVVPVRAGEMSLVFATDLLALVLSLYGVRVKYRMMINKAANDFSGSMASL